MISAPRDTARVQLAEVWSPCYLHHVYDLTLGQHVYQAHCLRLGVIIREDADLWTLTVTTQQTSAASGATAALALAALQAAGVPGETLQALPPIEGRGFLAHDLLQPLARAGYIA